MEGAQPSGEAYRPPLALRAALTAAMSRRSGSAGNGAVSSTDKGPEASVVSALSPRTSDSGACNLTVEDLLAHAALLVGPDGRCTTPHCPHGNPGAHPRRGTVASVSAETEASANARPASGESAPVASSHQGIASTLLSKVAAIKLERQRSTDNQLPSNQTRLERAVSDASPLAPAPVMSTSGQLRANFAQKFANKMREKAKEQKQKMASVGAGVPRDLCAHSLPRCRLLNRCFFACLSREFQRTRRRGGPGQGGAGGPHVEGAQGGRL